MSTATMSTASMSSVSASAASRPTLLQRYSYQSDMSSNSAKTRLLEVFEVGQPVRVRYRYGGLDTEHWAGATVLRARGGALYDIELPGGKKQHWTVSARDLRSVAREQEHALARPTTERRVNINDVVFAQVSNGSYSVFVPARVVAKEESSALRVMFLEGMLKGKEQIAYQTEVYSKERASALKKAGRNVLGSGAKAYRF